MTAPLKGIRVLDLSQGIAGPGAGMLCALWGADVIKVEPPHGDWIRGLGSTANGVSSNVIPYNTGKRSIAVDLKKPEGVEAILEIATHVDVVLESFRPGVVNRLGLGFATIRARNPGVIFVSVSGFGQSGPYVSRPCSDTVAQAFSGLMSVNTGRDGIPGKIDTTIIDAVTSLYAFQAISMHVVAAKFQQDSDAAGVHLDISLSGASAAIQAPKIVDWAMTDGNTLALNAPAGSYATADGWIAITLVKEENFTQLAKVLGLDYLLEDVRYDSFASRAANIEPLRAVIDQCVSQKTTAQWVELLQANDVLCNAINDYGDWLDDPQVVDQEFAPVRDVGAGLNLPLPVIPGAPANFDARVPGIGEHTREILGETTMTPDRIEELIRDAVVHIA